MFLLCYQSLKDKAMVKFSLILFRGMPVAHHGKNPVWFVFHCTNKLQSQPIGLRKIFIDYFFL